VERGIVVSYKTIRRWAIELGSEYARRLKRKAANRDNMWRLDEVGITISGKKAIPGALSVSTDMSSTKSCKPAGTHRLCGDC
jgi:hypothetical protein